jgi:predicted MFS family arabinose efflux permease
VAGVAGSVVGLVVGGRLADAVGFATTFSVLAIGPTIVLILVIFLYPETAGYELEELNPSDQTTPPAAD